MHDILLRVRNRSGETLLLLCTLDALRPQEQACTPSTPLQREVLITMSMRDVTSSERRKAAARRLYECAYMAPRADDAELRSLFTPMASFAHKGPRCPCSESLASANGLEAFLDSRGLLALAFGDLRFEILEQTCKADEVITTWQWTGTHSGDYHTRLADGSYAALAPTYQTIRTQGIAVDTIRGGKVVDHVCFWDEEALRMQLLAQGEGKQWRGTRHTPAPADAGPATVRLRLSVMKRWRDNKFVRVVAALGVSTPASEEVALKGEMQAHYQRKVLSQLAYCRGEGIALCEAVDEGGGKALPVMLCSDTFAALVGVEGQTVLTGRLEPLLRSLLVQPEEEADGHWSTTDPEAEGAASDPLAAIRAALQGQPSTTPLHVQCADGRHRCLLLSLSRFIYESKAYIAALLHDMNWPQAPLVARPPKIGGADLRSLYHHRAPRSWLWFNGRGFEVAMVAALHSLNLMITLVDMAAADQPLVWLSGGFERVTGFKPAQVLGTNCRFLQAPPTDPLCVERIRSALRREATIRANMYNEGAKDSFWNSLALYPGYRPDSDQLRYYFGVGTPLSTEHMKTVARILVLTEDEATGNVFAPMPFAGWSGQSDCY